MRKSKIIFLIFTIGVIIFFRFNESISSSLIDLIKQMEKDKPSDIFSKLDIEVESDKEIYYTGENIKLKMTITPKEFIDFKMSDYVYEDIVCYGFIIKKDNKTVALVPVLGMIDRGFNESITFSPANRIVYEENWNQKNSFNKIQVPEGTYEIRGVVFRAWLQPSFAGNRLIVGSPSVCPSVLNIVLKMGGRILLADSGGAVVKISNETTVFEVLDKLKNIYGIGPPCVGKELGSFVPLAPWYILLMRGFGIEINDVKELIPAYRNIICYCEHREGRNVILYLGKEPDLLFHSLIICPLLGESKPIKIEIKER
jgi:hypothetical protein